MIQFLSKLATKILSLEPYAVYMYIETTRDTSAHLVQLIDKTFNVKARYKSTKEKLSVLNKQDSRHTKTDMSTTKRLQLQYKYITKNVWQSCNAHDIT